MHIIITHFAEISLALIRESTTTIFEDLQGIIQVIDIIVSNGTLEGYIQLELETGGTASGIFSIILFVCAAWHQEILRKWYNTQDFIQDFCEKTNHCSTVCGLYM